MAGKRDLGTLRAFLELNTDAFSKALGETQKNLRKFGREWTAAGKELGAKITLPLAAVGTVATKAAIDFNSAFGGVRKTVDASAEQFKVLEKGIIDLSKRMPTSAVEIAKVTEAAGQLGIKNESLLGFTETMVMLGDTTNLSADQAATSLARFANITEMSQSDFDRLGSTVVDLGNKFAATESEIVELGTRLAGAGSQIKLSEAEIMGFAAALASVGIEAEAGGSAMSRTFREMQIAVATGGKDLEAFAKVAKLSNEDFSKLFSSDSSEAVLRFVKGLSDVNAAGGTVALTLKDLGITELRQVDTLSRLAGAYNVTESAVRQSSISWYENTALVDEAKKRYETFSAQLEIAKNRLTAVAIDIGNLLAPQLVGITNRIVSLAEGFQSLDPKLRNFIVYGAEIAAALGGVGLAVGAVATFLGGPLTIKLLAVTTLISGAAAAFITWKDEINLLVSTFKVQFPVMTKIVEVFIEALKKIPIILASVVSSSVALVKKLSGAFEALPFGIGQSVKAISALSTEVGEFRDTYNALATNKANWDFLSQTLSSAATVAKGKLVDLGTTVSTFYQDKWAKFVEASKKGARALGGAEGDRGSIEEAAKKAKKALDDLGKSLQANVFSSQEDSLYNAIATAFTQNDEEGLELWSEQLKEHTRKGIEQGYIEAGGVVTTESTAIIDEITEYEYQKKFDNIQALKDEEKDSSQENVSFWQGLMEDAISETRFNWEEQGKKAAVEIASVFLSSFDGLTEVLQTSFKEGAKTLKDIWANVFKGTFKDSAGIGGFGGAINDSIKAIGPAIATQLATLVAQFSVSGVKNIASGDKLSFEEQLALALPTFGASFLYNPAVDFFGGKEKDKDTEERKKVEGFLEDFFGVNVEFGDGSKFKENWSQSFQEIAGEGTGTFEALGAAIANFAGVSSEYAGQIGYILAENLSGNLDNARLMVQALGLDSEELTKIYEEMGLKGSASWAQVFQYQSQVDQLTGKGLVDLGNVKGAYDQIIASAGKGLEYIQAVKNFAIEAGEAGADSLAELEAALVSSGQFTQEQVDQLLGAFASAGITSMEQLESASNQTLAGIAFYLEEAGIQWASFGESISESTEQLSELEDKLKGISKDIDITVNIKYVEENSPPEAVGNALGNVFKSVGIEKFATGGVVSTPTMFRFAGDRLGVMGEAGPEAIMPLSRTDDGELGVRVDGEFGSGLVYSPVINVDARGAAPGEGEAIVEALKTVHQRAVQDAVRVMRDMRVRGAA